MFWLPDVSLRNYADKILLDFLLLMCACQQRLVFRIENYYEDMKFPGGSNKSIVNAIDSGEIPIDGQSFVSSQKNYLDILKCIVFLGFFWITLAIMFLAGSRNITIYSIGYLIGSFIFLWQGNDFYLRPIKSILRWWSALVAYNIFVITSKSFLRLVSCNFMTHLNRVCYFNKIFDISCGSGTKNNVSSFFKKFLHFFTLIQIVYFQMDCQNEMENGLVWDVVSFVFLIVQLRIFQSCYFFLVVKDTKDSKYVESRCFSTDSNYI